MSSAEIVREERERLLSEHEGCINFEHEDASRVHPAFDVRSHIPFFVSIFILKFLAQFTNGVLELPLLRLVERTICANHYKYGAAMIANLGESACKTKEIQDKLAQVMGLRTTFDSLPCMIVEAQKCHLNLCASRSIYSRGVWLRGRHARPTFGTLPFNYWSYSLLCLDRIDL